MNKLLKFGKRRPSFEEEGGRIEETSFVVVDTELTGLDGKRDSIVSIGAVRMVGGRIRLGDTFYRLVNPETALTPESVVIHQITPSDVMQKPDIDVVLTEFIDFCGRDVVVGYCVDIDMEFLEREAKRITGFTFDNDVIDVRGVFEWVRDRDRFRGAPHGFLPARYRLYDIARYYGITVNGSHNALMDAFITAQVFMRLIPELAESDMRSIEDLKRISCRFKGGERQSVGGICNF